MSKNLENWVIEVCLMLVVRLSTGAFLDTQSYVAIIYTM